MSNVSIQLCDLCEVALEGYHPRSGTKKVKEMDGLVIIVGYSNGGWGYRQDEVNFSGEVCRDCFNKVMEKAKELNQILESLKPKKKGKVFKLLG